MRLPAVRSVVRRPSRAFALASFLAMGVLLWPTAASATWSIVLVNRRTQEVGISSVTCLTTFDLRAITPVILVERGAGAVQAAGDFDGLRRPVIRDELLLGTAPQAILAILSTIPGHASRQYGIVDVEGGVMTFSGSQNFPWAGGVTGEFDDYSYAIQGNILAGACVVPAIENAIITNPNDLSAKLIAGMLAARSSGGDGRCSCSPGSATACGCPVSGKSGHIGYLIVARAGDTDDAICNSAGCADGDYYLDLNVPFQSPSDPDPVIQLNTGVIQFRQSQVGVPDAVQSIVDFALGASDFQMTIDLRDRVGDPVQRPILSVTVAHENDSAGLASIGPVRDLGGGIYQVTLTPPATGEAGRDRFRVTIDDGARPVVLMPRPEVCMGPPEDCDGNGLSDGCEIALGLVEDLNGSGALDLCERFRRGDTNHDGAFDVADAVALVQYLFDPTQPAPVCLAASDVNDDTLLDLADPIFGLGALFSQGPPPPPPFPDCGLAPSPGGLPCAPNPDCDR